VAYRWCESARDQAVGDVSSLGRSSLNHQVRSLDSAYLRFAFLVV